MKKAVRKGASKAVALVLSLAMIFGMVPMVSASAGNTADAQDNFDRIVHLDMGRKYFTPDWIKSLIDEMAKLGYNQLELDFGNSEAGQLRFALDNMRVTYTYVSKQEMVLVDDADAEEAPAVPVETEQPSEEVPAAPVETEQPSEEAPATPVETEQPAEEAPAAPAETEEPAEEQPAETVEPSTPVSDEVLEQAAELGGNGDGVLEYTYVNTLAENTIDLSTALPKDENSQKQYITESEMKGIIAHARDKGIEIVPLLNSPGHFGAVLCAADKVGKDFRYQGSNSLDITDNEARAFGQAVVQKYAAWFANQGCTTFNIGADEFANDSGMGFANLQTEEAWADFDTYITALYNMLISEDYATVRMFNDGVNYGPDYGYGYKHTSNIPKSIQICYWSCGWDGYDVASASDLATAEYSLINTNGDYYFVLKTKDGKDVQVQTEEAALGFSNDGFMGSTVSNSTGSMFCIWCDEPLNATQDEIMEAVKAPMTAVAYQMQGGQSGTGRTYEEFKQGAVDSVTDASTGVTVSVDGVTSMTVKSAEVPALSGQSYVAYDMKPAMSDGSLYTGEAQVTIPLGELAGYDASKLTGFVVEANGTITLIPGTRSGSNYIFTMPHFSVGGVAVLETENIQIAKGASHQVTVSGDVTQNSYDINESIATVDVKYLGDEPETSYEFEPVSSISRNEQYIIKSGDYYLQLNGSSLSATTNVQDATLWTAGGNGSGTLYCNGYYLQYSSYNGLTTTSTSYYATSWQFNRSKGLYCEDGWWRPTNYYITYSNGRWTVSTNGSNQVGTRKTVTTEGRDESVITFTGVSEGTTTVTIGGTVYQIKVVPESLSGVKIEVDYFITNKKIKDINGNTSEYIYASEDSVYSEGGALFSDLVLGVGYTDLADITKSSEFWKGTKLDEAHHQYGDDEEKGPPDQTKNGYDFTYIRYWGGKWGVSADGTSWKNVNSGDQLVAYYLQVTDVTDEVTTKVVDWGEPYSAWLEADSDSDWHWFWDGYVGNGSKFIFLDFAVVYEDSTQNPSTFPVDNTWFYHYDVGSATSRVLNPIYFTETDEYEIYKITVQNGTCGDTYRSAKNFKPTYSGEEVTIWTEEDGTEPSAELTYTAKRSGKLLRIYVRTKQTEDSLTVHYMEGTPNSAAEFYQYYIDVPAGTSFDAGFALDPTDEEYGLKNNSVKNTLGVTQHVSTHLDSLPEISAEYRGSQYDCTEVIRSEDGREVYLYYTFNDEEYKFVVDYGLPLVISAADLGLDNNVWTSVEVAYTPLYGSAVTSTDNNKLLTYTPNTIIQNSERIRLTLKDSKTATEVTHTIRLIPASTVYYEAEDFVTTLQGSWTEDGSAVNTRTQAADKLGDSANNYGSDPSYDNNALGSSNGAALVTEVKPSGTGENTTWPSATFTFTGTGADIISQTDSTSTWLLVEVENVNKTVEDRAYLVNNHYSAENSNVGDAIYQVPVIKIAGLDYGTYTVTVKPFYDTNDKQLLAVKGQESFKFYLDAIRVYKPLGDQGDRYYTEDGEANAQFINLSKCDLTSEGLWVDRNPRADVGTYKNIGPNNEIYLAAGQSVTITLPESVNVAGKSAQIGARLMNGKNSVKISVGGQNITVDSTVDQYYTVANGVTREITITNSGSGSGIVAVTTLKLTDGSN